MSAREERRFPFDNEAPVVEVTNLERAKRFYGEVLGFALEGLSKTEAAVRGPVCFRLVKCTNGRPECRGFVIHVSGLRKLAEHFQVLHLLMESGYEEDEEGWATVVIRDPDGHVFFLVETPRGTSDQKVLRIH